MTALFCFPNRIDQSVLSGGDWVLPLANIQDRMLRHYAISDGLDESATQLDIALDKAVPVRILAVPSHNLTPNAEYRLLASAVSGDYSAPLYDTGWLPAWPSALDAQAAWEAAGDYRLYRPEDADAADFRWCLTHIPPVPVEARYWRLQLRDPSNAAGEIRIGRLFIGGGFVAARPVSYGGQIGWESDTGVVQATSGVERFDVKDAYRVSRFSFGLVPEAQAFARHFELMRRAGLDREILFVPDPAADGADLTRTAFLGRLRQLNALEQAAFGYRSTAYEIKELL